MESSLLPVHLSTFPLIVYSSKCIETHCVEKIASTGVSNIHIQKLVTVSL